MDHIYLIIQYIFNYINLLFILYAGHPSYLSYDICNEFIQHMAAQVSKEIIEELKLSKYYSICADSTPDVSHVDQLTFIVRFITSAGIKAKAPVTRNVHVVKACNNLANLLVLKLKCIYLTILPFQFHRGASRAFLEIYRNTWPWS